ncbi:MAG: protein serine/threonine phosphatase [Bacteroidetes bacterium]|nr:protein serine/threonine phosphatase [Bacteroidota bacterium]
MRKTNYSPVLIFLLAASCCFSQQKKKVDSLTNLLQNPGQVCKGNCVTDTVLINTYFRLGKEFQNSNPDTAIYFHTKATTLAKQLLADARLNEQLKNFTLIKKAEAVAMTGWDYHLRTDNETAVNCFEQVLEMLKAFTESEDTILRKKSLKLKASVLSNYGIVYDNKGEYPEAIRYYTAAMEINKAIGFNQGYAVNLGNIGGLYYQQGDYTKSLDAHFKALKISSREPNSHYEAINLGNIGNVYLRLDDYPKALDYYFKALKVYEASGNKVYQTIMLGNIGVVYKQQGNFSKALECYFKALKLTEETGNRQYESANLINIGSVYNTKGDSAAKSGNRDYAVSELYPKALEYYLKSLKINEETGNKQYQVVNSGNIANVYTILKKYSLAEKYLDRSFALATELNSLDDVKQSHQYYSELYEAMNQPAKALHHYKLFIKYRDSLFNEENTKASMQKEMQFNYEKKAAADSVRIAQEKKVMDVQLEKEKTTRFALYGGLALVFVFSVFMYNRFRVTRRQKRIIEEKEKETQKQNEIITQQKLLVEDKQKEILDSIYYARRIQQSLLPTERYITRLLSGKKNSGKS